MIICKTGWQTMCIVSFNSVMICFLFTVLYCIVLYCPIFRCIVSYWCRRMIICKTGWQPVTAGGSSMITMQCTATLRFSEKNIWNQNVKKRKIAALRSQWPAVHSGTQKRNVDNIQRYKYLFDRMLHNLKGLGISYLAYKLLFFISWSSIALFF